MNLAGLEPGAKVKVQETYIISKDLPLSDYYCMVHADSKKTVDETNETNNFSTYGYKIKVLAKAYTDVFVADLSFTKQNTLAGKSIKLMYQMGNNNESSAAGVTVCAVLSADNKVSVAGIKSGKDIIIGEKFYELIESGAQNTFFEDEANTSFRLLLITLLESILWVWLPIVNRCSRTTQSKPTTIRLRRISSTSSTRRAVVLKTNGSPTVPKGSQCR